MSTNYIQYSYVIWLLIHVLNSKLDWLICVNKKGLPVITEWTSDDVFVKYWHDAEYQIYL